MSKIISPAKEYFSRFLLFLQNTGAELSPSNDESEFFMTFPVNYDLSEGLLKFANDYMIGGGYHDLKIIPQEDGYLQLSWVKAEGGDH